MPIRPFFICRTSVFCSGGLVSDQVSGCGRNFCFRCFHCFLKRGVVFYDALFRMREEAARLRLAEAAGYRTGESASAAGAENFAEKR